MGETKKTTMLDLTGQYLELLELASDPDVDPDAVKDTLEALTGEIEVKADSYAVVMKSLKNKIALFKAEYKRLKDAADRMQSNYDNMLQTIKGAMEAMGITEIQGQYNGFKIVGNGGVQPLKITGDVPESYTKVTISPDNEKIRKALEEGKKLDFAYLEERGTNLRIK